MPRLTDEQRNQAIGMLESQVTVSEVARRFNTSRPTIYKLQTRVQVTGTVRDTPRSGRPCVTNQAEDRHLRVVHLRNRFKTASSTAREWTGQHQISRYTVKRRLKVHGIVARRAAERCALLVGHRQARLNWARLHRAWIDQQWDRVIFTDECRFQLESHDGRQRVYRRRGERFSSNCVSTASDKRGLMVWGGVTTNGRTDLVVFNGSVTARRYINEVLQANVLPFLAQHGRQHIFQQDNAPAHSAHLTRNFFQQNQIDVMTPWPSRSPDLNVIEHVWDKMKRDIRSQNPPPRTIQQLQRAVVNSWQNIPQNFIKTLVRSMERRCQEVINARGGYTHY